MFFKSYMVSKKHALKTGLLIKFADCLSGNRLQELQQEDQHMICILSILGSAMLRYLWE